MKFLVIWLILTSAFTEDLSTNYIFSYDESYKSENIHKNIYSDRNFKICDSLDEARQFIEKKTRDKNIYKFFIFEIKDELKVHTNKKQKIIKEIEVPLIEIESKINIGDSKE